MSGQRDTFIAIPASERENFGETVDLVNSARLRARGLAGFHRKDERCGLFRCQDGSAFVANKVPAVRIHHLAQAAAALGIEVAVRDEGGWTSDSSAR
jgi:hypothetical protein